MEDLFSKLEQIVDNIYPSENALKEKLSKDRLKIYLGIDPTSSNIHLGHLLPLQVLRVFQDAGHEVILLIGDFTAKLGDPTGKDKQREPLEDTVIKENYSLYERQVKKILDFQNNAPKILFNSTWWGNMKLDKFFGILSKTTVSQLIERDLFQERLKKGSPIATSEFLYPVLQGFDSVSMDIDIEVGGSDQTFNMLLGRDLLKKYSGKDKVIITTPLLEGTDGRKMSKTYDNTIDLTDNPVDIFGKVMSLNDNLIEKYFSLVTRTSKTKVKEILSSKKPMESKKILAHKIVTTIYDDSSALMAQKEFERVFQKGGVPKPQIAELKERAVSGICELLLEIKLASSNSQAQRLVLQGAVKINGIKITDVRKNIEIKNDTLVQVGKFNSVKIKIK